MSYLRTTPLPTEEELVCCLSECNVRGFEIKAGESGGAGSAGTQEVFRLLGMKRKPFCMHRETVCV